MEESNIAKSVTVQITGDNFKEPLLWTLVDYMGRPGIIYRVRKGVDEDGPNKTYSIHGWRIYKYKWVNSLRLFILKICVKYFNLWG